MTDKVDNQEATTENDLEKAMDILKETAASKDDEKQTLLSKAVDGSITPEENDRLADLLAGKKVEETLEDEVQKSLSKESDDRLEKALDVSEYLEGLHKGLVEALGNVAQHLEKSDARSHNFNVALAKGVCALADLTKSLDSRLGVIEEQPAAGPKAIQSTKQAVIEKSFAGQKEGEGERLNKSQVLDVLEEMHLESMEKGRQGSAKCGEDLRDAIVKYESTNRLSRPLHDELQAYRQATVH